MRVKNCRSFTQSCKPNGFVGRLVTRSLFLQESNDGDRSEASSVLIQTLPPPPSHPPSPPRPPDEPCPHSGMTFIPECSLEANRRHFVCENRPENTSFRACQQVAEASRSVDVAGLGSIEIFSAGGDKAVGAAGRIVMEARYSSTSRDRDRLRGSSTACMTHEVSEQR